MRIQPTSINFKNLYIPRNKNPQEFLFNDLLDVTNELKVPAIFDKDGVEFPYLTFALLDKLRELKLRWIDKK